MRRTYLLCLLLAACASPGHTPSPDYRTITPPRAESFRFGICPNATEVFSNIAFPAQASRDGVASGTAVVQFVVGVDGRTQEATVVEASHPVFGEAAVLAIAKFQCLPREHPVTVKIPFAFQLK